MKKNKALVLEVTTEDGGKVLKIKRRKYTGAEFYRGFPQFTASNGFVISSVMTFPDIVRDELELGTSKNLEARHCEEGGRYAHLIVPSEGWLDKLRVAVREYNEQVAQDNAQIPNPPTTETIS